MELAHYTNMNELLTNLLKLQDINFKETSTKYTQADADAVRALIPTQILGHYDRLIARGKKGVALVRNQVCTGCHMRLPIGTINTLMQGTDIQLCDTCGRYLYLVPATEEAAPTTLDEAPIQAVKVEKAAKRPRKKKVAATASDKVVEHAV
jgi:hypothetical protein